MTMTLTNFRARLTEVGLGDRVDDLCALHEPSVRLVPCQVDREEANAAGGSKLGGRPDLPPGYPWPRFGATPLSFIAQLRLEEIAPYDERGLLPPFGWLTFFYDTLDNLWGSAEDRGGWQVAYFPPETRLLPGCYPPALPERGRFTACSLVPHAELTFPSSDALCLEPLALTIEEHDLLRGAVNGSFATRTHSAPRNTACSAMPG